MNLTHTHTTYYSIRILLSTVGSRPWPLYQLDIKNALLLVDHQTREDYTCIDPLTMLFLGVNILSGTCKKDLYWLKHSPSTWFDRFNVVVLAYDFQHSNSDHSVFIRRSSVGTMVMIVYVNDIITSGRDYWYC